MLIESGYGFGGFEDVVRELNCCGLGYFGDDGRRYQGVDAQLGELGIAMFEFVHWHMQFGGNGLENKFGDVLVW